MRRALSMVLIATGFAVAVTAAGAAFAQSVDQATPKSFNYEIKDGKRVPKAQRQTAADGGWREEIRQGTCVTVKEKTASGEYKESRRCD